MEVLLNTYQRLNGALGSGMPRATRGNTLESIKSQLTGLVTPFLHVSLEHGSAWLISASHITESPAQQRYIHCSQLHNYASFPAIRLELLRTY